MTVWRRRSAGGRRAGRVPQPDSGFARTDLSSPRVIPIRCGCCALCSRRDKRKLIELKPGTKPLFFAGVHAAAPLLLPWIAAGMESCGPLDSLVGGGHGGRDSGRQTLRKYAKAGAKAWNSETESYLRRALDNDIPAIRSREPRLAELYEQGIRLALGQF